jgi:hypothetical protein
LVFWGFLNSKGPVLSQFSTLWSSADLMVTLTSHFQVIACEHMWALRALL